MKFFCPASPIRNGYSTFMGFVSNFMTMGCRSSAQRWSFLHCSLWLIENNCDNVPVRKQLPCILLDDCWRYSLQRWWKWYQKMCVDRAGTADQLYSFRRCWCGLQRTQVPAERGTYVYFCVGQSMHEFFANFQRLDEDHIDLRFGERMFYCNSSLCHCHIVSLIWV